MYIATLTSLFVIDNKESYLYFLKIKKASIRPNEFGSEKPLQRRILLAKSLKFKIQSLTSTSH